MKQFNNKFDTKEFLGKLISGGEEPKQKPGKRSHIPFRLNILFLVIFGLFVALIARLGYVQIIDAETIAQKVDSSTTVEIKESTPRGMIYDANGRVLAENVANASITYTRGNNITSESILAIAQKLNTLIDIPADDDLSDRDKRDYFLADPNRYTEVENRLTDAEKTSTDGTPIGNSELYAKIVEKVSEEELNFSPEEMKVATTFTKMNSAAALNTVFVKNQGVTNEELAIVAENGKELSGIATGTDWTRKYTEDENIRGILGSISTEQEGIPAESLDEYLDKGYLMNDRVGKSNLELQYEDYLQGKKAISEVKLDSKGGIESQVEKEAGEKGANLVLTINTEFQNQVQDIVQRNFDAIAGGAGIYSPGAYVVVMEPKTGAVLALAGVNHTVETTQTERDTLGTYLKLFEPGSTIKAATVAAGYENGVISGNETLTDQPIYLGSDSVSKSSWFNRYGALPVNVQQALEYSSNSYMMQIAIKLLGREYSRGMRFPLAVDQKEGYEKLRATFAEFGLGASTGLDLPKEETGLTPTNFEEIEGGKILDLSFGQFDTYTAMQLAQYISTVANGGKRVAAHVVEGIYGNDDVGNIDKNNVIKKLDSQVLNEIKISPDEMEIIQSGLHNVVYGNGSYTTGRALSASPVDLYAKTGTAETSITNSAGQLVNTVHSNLVAYTNTGDKDIAISVVLPNLTSENAGTNKSIALEIVNAYYNSLNAANNAQDTD